MREDQERLARPLTDDDDSVTREWLALHLMDHTNAIREAAGNAELFEFELHDLDECLKMGILGVARGVISE